MFRHGVRASISAAAAAGVRVSAATSGASAVAWRGPVASGAGVSAACWAGLAQVQRRGFAAGGVSEADATERIMSLLKGVDKVEGRNVTASSHFINDLGLDSLDTVEVVMMIEEEFNIEIPDKEFESIFTAADAVKYITSHPAAK